MTRAPSESLEPGAAGSGLQRERFGATGERWITARGRLEIEEPAPGVVLTRFSGHGQLAHAEGIMERFDAAIARYGSIVVFDDWERGEGYDSDTRVRLTEYTRARLSVVTFHILVRSRLFAMGLSVANLALGGKLVVYGSRPSFERALGEATAPSSRRAPTSRA
jgi:hypothetical protein